ncbi:condensation domain-containing protein [Actinoplanes couchii]|uniref:Condensation domain-containing protein n=1 Tax=Actinoplanes couchii TaxID=403638 RepID=A0ABQ3XTC9_9ACTN|nr:condensation domain-containing protein [Actinoplanes couchii]MDR6324149.1 hypothetical protein [Actinoplanes couchii]GID61767.1 hypothetical protein Aco03nite_101710 [Actinoplanes couchii]
MSYAERGVWFLQQAAGAEACNLGAAVRIPSPLDPERLFAALTVVAGRHEAMRTTYRIDGASLVAVVLPENPPQTRLIDAVDWTTEQLADAVRAVHAEPFDLAGGSPCRLVLWNRGAAGHVMFFAMHHAVTDWNSMVQCAAEMFELYGNGLDVSALPAVTAGYGDFAAAQQAMLAGPDGAAALAYWNSILPAARPPRPVPADRERSGRATAQQILPFGFGAEAKKGLDALAWRLRVPVYLVLLGRWASALRPVETGQPLVVGLSRTLRKPAFARTVGCFTNTIPVVVGPEAGPDLPSVVDGLRRQLQESYRHQGYPNELLARHRPDLGAAGGRPAMFDAHFNYVPGDADNLGSLFTGDAQVRAQAGGLLLESFPALPTVGMWSDFSLHLTEAPQRLVGMVGYDSATFSAATADAVSRRFADPAGHPAAVTP